ncbi:hypothetical protein KN825_15345, partial [Weizmannia coagulans]|nr:hypothetical protein [Heyndrickxia coagulans]
FEAVQIILIIISLICFTEKVYGSSPYSPNTNNNKNDTNNNKNDTNNNKNEKQKTHFNGSNPYLFFQSQINKQIFLHFVFSSLIFVSQLQEFW